MISERVCIIACCLLPVACCLLPVACCLIDFDFWRILSINGGSVAHCENNTMSELVRQAEVSRQTHERFSSLEKSGKAQISPQKPRTKTL